LSENQCFGCKLANNMIDTNIVYENDFVTCILDIAPFNEGHILILPKQHYHDVDDLDDITANEIMKASVVLTRLLKEQFKPDGITIIQNGGKFNDLTHYHMHVFPRYESDGFGWVEPLDTTNAKERLTETREKLIKLINQQLCRTRV
jgi:histidine triad (HIT) family protein